MIVSLGEQKTMKYKSIYAAIDAVAGVFADNSFAVVWRFHQQLILPLLVFSPTTDFAVVGVFTND